MDGHERADVIEDRGEFLKTMTSLGFFNGSNAPTPKPLNYYRIILCLLIRETLYSGSIMQMTINQPKDNTMQVMRPKEIGAGLMVSDFIEEKDGYLAISDSLYKTIKQGDPSVSQSVRVIFEYGKTRDGYWNNKLFMEQMKVAVRLLRRSTHLVRSNIFGSLTTRVDTLLLYLTP